MTSLALLLCFVLSASYLAYEVVTWRAYALMLPSFGAATYLCGASAVALGLWLIVS